MADDAFRHEAFLYEGESQFLDGTAQYVSAGVDAGEPVLVMVLPRKIELLRRELGEAAPVLYADVQEVGANPARLIPAWRAFVKERGGGGRRVRGVAEPIWPGRSADEVVECQRHESLLNIAFADDPCLSLLCARTPPSSRAARRARAVPTPARRRRWRRSAATCPRPLPTPTT
jgi:hypothetical protein